MRGGEHIRSQANVRELPISLAGLPTSPSTIPCSHRDKTTLLFLPLMCASCYFGFRSAPVFCSHSSMPQSVYTLKT